MIVIIIISITKLDLFAEESFSQRLQSLASKEPPEWMLKQIDQDLEPYKKRGSL